MMEVAIQVDDLRKNYGSNPIIKGISFSVYHGEIFALLGTNGAGKTTTLECIEGLRKYDQGKIIVNGKVGVQLQTTSLPSNMKAIEAYRLFCKWNKVKGDPNIFEAFAMDEFKNKRYKELSTGQKRRLHLALALIGNPDILFLDEPTAGLDVEGRVSLHEQIRKLKEQGKTIIMASHDMAEVESLCDRIGILKEGRIVYLGSTENLTQEVAGESKVYLRTVKPLPEVDYEQEYASFTTTNIGDTLLKWLEYCKETGNTVLDIKVEKATLEQRFLAIAREGKV